MRSRLRSHLPGWLLLIGVAGLAGCESINSPLPPIPYRESERAATELASKPKIREQIRTILAERFGSDVQHMTVPKDSGLRDGGIYLANQMKVGDKAEAVTEPDPAGGAPKPIAGGYALYRNNCLQCHGVFGAGDGPTSAALFPRPRDYRPGIFKFTSTNPVNAKPSRDDLRRTLLYGLHGTSMPGFDAILTPSEIEQVIDYMTFLSIRGETERYLIDEAVNADKDDLQGFDLRLTSWGDGSQVPTSGKNLVVVGVDTKDLLHLRIFDADGNRTKDTDETQVAARSAAVSALKQRLPGLLPPYSMTDAEQVRIFSRVASIFDLTVLEADLVNEFVDKAASSWTAAEGQVVRPNTPRVAATPESVRRGRDLFLGANTEGPKLECTSCHGTGGKGNGPAFVDRAIFDDVVFRFDSLDKAIESQYKIEQERKTPHGHEAVAPSTDATKAVGEFLTAQPALLKILRDDHKLFNDGSITDPQFEYLVKNDMAKVADAARALVPSLDEPEFRDYLVSKYDLWTKGSLDFWNKPLRPANLLDGVYKGGRRPIDLYWRLAKGINGAKMPAHSNILTDDQIWDIVNFVLALPDQPGLLKVPTPTAPRTAAVAPGDRGRGTR